MNPIDVHAQAISDRVYGNRKQGFVLSILTILSIVTTLIPMLVQCFQKKSAAEVKEAVTKGWDASKADNENRGYDDLLVRRTMVQARRACRDKGEKHVSREELREIAIQTLDEARLSDDNKVGAVLVNVPDGF